MPPFAWEPDKGTHIAFIPRNGTVADVKWVSAPPCYVFHPMNHYETDDGKIVVDVMKFDVAPLFPLPDGSPGDQATAVRRADALDVRPDGTATPSGRSSSTTARASSRASTNASA